MSAAEVNLRAILRIVLVIVGVVLTLYVIYLLRKPIGWIVLATFIAVAMSAPVNLLARHMHRGLAIALSYLGLLAIPVLLALILVPPIVNGIDDLATKAPDYAAQAQDYVQKNKTLRKLEDDYGVITQLEEQAKKLPQKLGTAAGTLSDIGVGVVNSVFAARDHPHPLDLHGRRRPKMGAERALLPASRAPRAPRPRPEPHQHRGGQLRRRRPGPGDDRGHHELHRHEDPRDPVRRAARRHRRLRRPHPADRRDHRRRARRDRHHLRRLPDRHDHLGHLGGRLPAARELGHPAPDPAPRGRPAPVPGAGLGPLRRDAVRRRRRAAGDPGGRLGADRGGGVVAVPPVGARPRPSRRRSGRP